MRCRVVGSRHNEYIVDNEGLVVRVLIVDDEQPSHFAIAAILREAGYETVEAANVYEALHRLAIEPDRIGLVISDLQMPQMDGLRLLEEIKRRYPTLMVMVVSGRTQAAIEARGRGAACYLPKPFSRQQVVAVVNTVADHGIGAIKFGWSCTDKVGSAALRLLGSQVLATPIDPQSSHGPTGAE